MHWRGPRLQVLCLAILGLRAIASAAALKAQIATAQRSREDAVEL